MDRAQSQEEVKEVSVNDVERKRALKELDKEKDTMYEELKSSLGVHEADAQMRQYMVSQTFSS